MRRRGKQIEPRVRVGDIVRDPAPRRRAPFDPRLDVPVETFSYAQERCDIEPTEDLLRGSVHFETLQQAAVVFFDQRGALLKPEIADAWFHLIEDTPLEELQQSAGIVTKVLTALTFADPHRFARLSHRDQLGKEFADTLPWLTHNIGQYFEYAIAARCAGISELSIHPSAWQQVERMVRQGVAEHDWETVIQMLGNVRWMAPERFHEICPDPSVLGQLPSQAEGEMNEGNIALHYGFFLTTIFAEQVDYHGPGRTPRILFSSDLEQQEPLPTPTL